MSDFDQIMAEADAAEAAGDLNRYHELTEQADALAAPAIEDKGEFPNPFKGTVNPTASFDEQIAAAADPELASRVAEHADALLETALQAGAAHLDAIDKLNDLKARDPEGSARIVLAEREVAKLAAKVKEAQDASDTAKAQAVELGRHREAASNAIRAEQQEAVTAARSEYRKAEEAFSKLPASTPVEQREVAMARVTEASRALQAATDAAAAPVSPAALQAKIDAVIEAFAAKQAADREAFEAGTRPDASVEERALAEKVVRSQVASSR